MAKHVLAVWQGSHPNLGRALYRTANSIRYSNEAVADSHDQSFDPKFDLLSEYAIILTKLRELLSGVST